MVKYTCLTCNKSFDRRSNYISHINRKYPCLNIPSNINNIPKYSSEFQNIPNIKILSYRCDFCSNKYNEKYNLNKHLKICKIKLQNDINKKDHQLKEELFKNLLKEMNLLRQENKESNKQLDKIQKQNDKLQDEIRNLKSIKTINNTNCNNTNTINQTINILSYKDTDMSHMTILDYVKCLDRANFCVPQLVENIHFNPNKPENHNIYIPNLKNNLIMLFDGNGWNLHNRDETIDDIYEDKTNILVDKIDDWEKMGKKIDKVAIRKFNRYLGKKDTPGISNKIKEEIKLILYNKREMVRHKI